MRVVATSDLHGNLPEIPECDLLLIAGDVTPVTTHERGFQARWLRTTFTSWLREQPAKNIVWTAGNHDFVLQHSFLGRELPGEFLNNRAVEVDGLKVWGSPFSNRFGGWAFMDDEIGLARIWDTIPRDIDILMVHGPAYGILDLVEAQTWDAKKREWEHSENVGSVKLADALKYDEWPNLKLFIHGHIHEQYGVEVLPNGGTAYNVSHVNARYEPVNEPVVIEL